MKQKAIVLALGGLLTASAAHADIDLMGKELQIYGKIHASMDYYDRGPDIAAIPEQAGPPVVPAVPAVEGTGTEITSNSSRLGFKGVKDLRDDVAVTWMFESDLDYSGETAVWNQRNRFIGLTGAWGTVKLGGIDTPFKEVGSEYTAFGDTIGDRRSLLGSTSTADNQFNQRAKSMIDYEFKAGDFNGTVMYSPDFEDKNSPDTGNNSLLGLGVGYKAGDLSLAAAYEKQNKIDGTNGKDASGFRLGAKYKIDALQIGGIYESLSDDGYGKAIARDAYGVNASYKLQDFTFVGEYLHTNESDLGNDAASQYNVGVFYALAKSTKVYAMYSSLDNDPAAKFKMAASGHGISYAPTKTGETVSSASMGVMFSF